MPSRPLSAGPATRSIGDTTRESTRGPGCRGVGLSNSRLRPTSGAYEAGVDTLRELFSIDGTHDRRLADAMCPDGRPHQYEVAGARIGWIPGHGLLWVEGRATKALGGDSGLCPASVLGDVHEARRRALRSYGFWHVRPEGVSRLDVTVGLQFGERDEGLAVLQGMGALDVPRRKPAVYGRPPETVYLLTPGGRVGERVYDKGLEAGTARRGHELRFEGQLRFTSRTRRATAEWEVSTVREKFQRRFDAMGQAADGLHVMSDRVLARKIADLVGEQKLTGRQAELLLGHIAAERVGIVRPKETRRRRRLTLRQLGLAAALDGIEDEVDVDLAAVLEEALTTDRWSE